MPAAEAPAGPSDDWLRAARRAKQLSWLSLVWMGAEGAIAITAGVLAGSIALIGFGIDSAIEGVASLVIVWRFTGRRLLSLAAEKRAQKLVATQFFILAPYIAFEAVQHLAAADRTDVSVLGMILTATSLVGMPFLGIAKQHLAVTLGSSATHGEGSQNLICAYLAGAVFLGLAGNALLGWWWLDPLARSAYRRRRGQGRRRNLARRGMLRSPTLFRRRSAKTTAATEVPDLRSRLAAARHRWSASGSETTRDPALQCGSYPAAPAGERIAMHPRAPPAPPYGTHEWSDSSTRVSAALPERESSCKGNDLNSFPLALPRPPGLALRLAFLARTERAPKPLAAARRPEGRTLPLRYYAAISLVERICGGRSLRRGATSAV